MDDFSLIQKVIIWGLPMIFAITVHEVAHGWVAMKLGDRTAQMLGRLTLNPIKHIDPFGTIVVPALLFMAGGFMFGWAKPVPVTYQNLRKPKSDMAWVAIAGPASNLVMAILWAVEAKIGLAIYSSGIAIGELMIFMGIAGVIVNLMLMTLNLLPLPPLDGGRILTSLLPGPLAWKVSRIEPYGFFILMVLLYFGILGQLIWPLISTCISIISVVFGVPQQLFFIALNDLS
ncbi:MAG: site-2 protease family protein [Gammaproteobacteria bacterium]|nr:MAG: site-2 protease family protein [Gammaproteobacteria bacterium]